MFSLKINQKQQPAPHQQDQKQRNNSSSSIIEQLIGQLKTPNGAHNENNKQDSFQRRLIERTNHLKAKLGQLQTGLGSDLRKSLNSLVQATSASAKRGSPVGAKNGAQRKLLTRQRSSGGSARRRLMTAVGQTPPLKRSVSLSQRRVSAERPQAPAERQRSSQAEPAQSQLAAGKVLIERNDWSTRSLQVSPAGLRPTAPAARPGANTGRGSFMGLFGRSQPQRRSPEPQRSAPVLFVPALQLLLVLVALLGAQQRLGALAAPISPFWTHDRPREAARANNELSDNLTNELFGRLRLMGASNLQSDEPRAEDDDRASLAADETVRRENKPGEFLWIERRRLNRDRALEPPAWLRARPIRGPREPVDEEEEEGPSLALGGRSRGNRQLRDSDGGLYDELVRQLVENAVGGRAFLEQLHDELESRTQSQRSRQDQSSSVLTGSGGGDGTGDSSGAADGSVAKQPSADETLVVAGDEVSDSGDITPLAPAPIIDRQSLQPQLPASKLALEQKLSPAQQANKQQQVGELLLAAPTSLKNQDAVLLQPTATDRLVIADLGAAAGNDGAPSGTDRGSLIDFLRTTSQEGQQMAQQQQPQLQEEPFHVFEDLDQADNSREIAPAGANQLQQHQSQSSGQEPAAKSSQLAAFEPEDSRLEKRSERQQQNGDGSPWRRPTFGRDVPAGSSGGDADVVKALARQLPAEPSAPDENSKLKEITIKLIRDGFYTHKQLLETAMQLKFSLEESLGLTRGAIEGVYPIAGQRRMMLKLNRDLLSASNRLALEREFGPFDASGSLTVDLPEGGAASQLLQADSLLTFLAEILVKINGEESTRNTRIARNGKTGEPSPQRGQLDEAGREDELDREEDDAAADESDEDDDPAASADWWRSNFLQTKRRRPVPVLSGAPSPFAPDELWLAAEQAAPLQQQPQHLPSLLAWGGPPQVRPFALLAENYPQRPWSVWSGLGRGEARRQALAADYPPSAIYGIDAARPPPQLQYPIESLLDQLDEEELLLLGQSLARIRDEQEQAAAQHVPRTGFGRNATRFGHLPALGRFFGAPRQDAADFRTATLWLSLVAFVAALAFTVFLVRLLTSRLFKAVHESRRLSNLSSFSYSTLGSKARFWPPFGNKRRGSRDELADEAGFGTIKGETASAPANGKDLGRAPIHKRGLSADSGLDTIDAGANESCAGSASLSSEKLRRNFDLLADRLTRFLSAKSYDNDEEAEPAAQSASAGQRANDLPAKSASKSEESSQFRSSTSYIRSLIEALTKAANGQTAAKTNEGRNGGRSIDDDDDDEDDDGAEQRGGERADEFAESDAATRPLKKGRRRRCTESCSSPGGEKHLFAEDHDEVMMSQMDISAAHLILDYMEKHLVDKERLRREWLELTATSGPNGGPAGPSKANQLLLQRLAKVALSEENFYKNRDPNVVPYDRNRVRLSRAPNEQQLGDAAEASASASGKQSRRQQRLASAGGARSSAGDYINASFIHDDDPRRPTHIIAQGPKEQTCGQFWQMVWEQEVSVIVMLTRLNESGAQMCHCYWPTSVAAGAEQTSKWAAKAVDGPATPLASSTSPPPSGAANRRGSVTSVFSGNSAGKQILQPIVAGAEPNDNVLSFELAGANGTPLKLEVHLVSEHVSSSDYLVRNMYLVNRNSGETRTVSQFHYLAWLEGRTPDNVRSFLQFRRKVHKSYRNSNSPILVHCSDGAGRSGTYALIDMILERIKSGAKEIDLRATLEHLRDQRPGLCASQSQFEFALVALAEEIQVILNALPR